MTKVVLWLSTTVCLVSGWVMMPDADLAQRFTTYVLIAGGGALMALVVQ